MLPAVRAAGFGPAAVRHGKGGEVVVMVDESARDAGDAVSERLRSDLADAKMQLQATSDVLTAIGRSVSDVDAILGTVVDNARRLCRADVAQIHLVEGEILKLARSSGLSEEGVDFMARHPVGPDRTSLIGRVRLYGRTQQITDVLSDPDYARFDLQRLAGLRTVLGVPMQLDSELVGVLLVWRTEVDPFGDRETKVLTTFATQAAIAIRQADLVRALEARQQELGQKVEQLEALGQIGQAVSSSLDLDEVLDRIVTHAVQLSGTDGGSMLEFVEGRFQVRAACGTSAQLLERLRTTRIDLDGTLVGRAAIEGRPLQVPDLRDASTDAHLRVLLDAGWKSLVAVPMLREGSIVGALVVRRRTVGGFSAEICDLLQTFAGQSALAILNARLFRELERKTAELQVASRHKSEFLASMSHELRTPLNAVIGFSEVLLERMFGDLNDRQEEYLRDIWSSGRHLLELLNDILDLSKVEAGRMEMERSTFSVPDVLDSCLSLMRERAERQGIVLLREVAADVGFLETDELRFKQVLLNLISNAVKFTPAGGEVVVRAAKDGAYLAVTVADTGIGIAPEDRNRIFESFQQGGRGASQQEGTGLGLTLSKRIVELIGGRMWLDSQVGVGSTFGFTVPMGTPVAEPADTTASTTGEGGPLIVVIEDDRRALGLLTVYLDAAGLQVVGVRDGTAGLDAVRGRHPAAVVLDIRLPDIDGWELLTTLKADPATAAVPVIVVSMLDERGKGFALGAAEYLVKPVNREDVLSALGRVGALPDGGTLLAIDDDPLAVELVRAILQPAGWSVLSAGDGEAGVALARSRRPAAILLDLLMPGLDGFGVVEALRMDPETAAIPIVVLTAKTLSSAERDRLRGRISYVAQKGDFDPARLVDLVRRATGRQAPSTADTP
ncbi:MAG TPA: response regulator [Jiangellaceae bacterium]|nr:response regulator [Jiangellaceae bacterium]